MADDLTSDDIDDEPEGPEGLDDDAEELVDDEGFVDDEFPDADDVLDDEEDDDEQGDDEESVPSRAKGGGGGGGGGKAKSATSDDEEGGEDDEDEPDPDDVEADLDTILKDRLVVVDDEEDDDDEPLEPEDKAEASKVRPRAPGEFVCQSCFLVKHPSQLADEALLMCRDCV